MGRATGAALALILLSTGLAWPALAGWEPHRPRPHVELNLGWRVVSLPPCDGYFADLLGYGYGDASGSSNARLAFELGLQVSYDALPWLEVAGGLNYVVTSVGARSRTVNESVGVHAFEIDLVRVRPVLRRNGFLLGVDLGLGLQLPVTVFSGQAEGHAPAFLVRPRLMVGLADGVRVGGQLGYAIAVSGADPRWHSAVALSGVSLGVWLGFDL